MNASISGLRAQIDGIDDQLWRLLNQRAQLARQIGQLKQDQQQPIMDKTREDHILERILQAKPGAVLSEQSIRAVFSEIIAACRALQFSSRVGFLGPIGTFSHGAALSHFGKHAVLLPYDNLSGAFADAAEGRLDYVLAPLENSSEGVVGQTLDLLSAHKLKVMAQFALRIHQSLMARSDNLKNINKIASHPQALAQSRGWLSLNLPGARLMPVASSAAAAALAEEDQQLAIVGPAQLAEFYNLTVLAENIEDNRQNQTLFVAVGSGANPKTGNDRTMLWFAAPHRAGSLYQCLKPLAQYQVNLTRLHSRPSSQGPWQYLFFLEMEGHGADENVAQAIELLRQQTEQCVILGSYRYQPLNQESGPALAAFCKG
jgi:chorismate mutase/prephenate dehydratase